MVRVQLVILLTCFSLAAGLVCRAEAEIDLKSQLPGIPPVEPSDALDTFIVEPGFRMELAAHEPLVTDPVAMAFDEHGRLFVVEMRGYSEQGDDRLGVVRRLTDSDADGRFDESTVYVDNLSWPTAVYCYDGGVFVGAAPDILYCKDTDGDGQTDIRQTVFTGFGRSNVQGLLNSFRWGLDNRIHGATSSAGGLVRKPHEPEELALLLRGRDFSFDPATLVLRPESGGGQHGMCFDRWGRKFNCSNSDHLRTVVIEDRYLARNPYFALPSASESIAADGSQAEVFRRSPVEPWRKVRTRLRIASEVPGPVEGGGRASGYFTSATGVTIYDGDAWPANHLPEQWPRDAYAIVGDVGSNLIHRKVVEPKGISFIGHRVDREHELVASTDIWFRPVQFCNGPDGSLYVADMYREVIEHPDSLPPTIKKHLDLTSGSDRGRIYRIVPEGFSEPQRIFPGDATTAELVEMLKHRNDWHRVTASRLLFEQQDPDAVEPLEKLVSQSDIPVARIHALAALDGLGELSVQTLTGALADRHPRVREHAVLLAGQFVGAHSALHDQLLAMASDADIRVRFQLALTLGDLTQQGVPELSVARVLSDLLRHDGDDHWLRSAVLSSSVDVVEPLIENLTADPDWATTEPGKSVLEELSEILHRKNRDDSRAQSLGRQELASEPLERPAQKGDVIERYLEQLGNITASADRGASIFKKNCAVCHDVDLDQGGVAPSVASFRNRGRDFILVNVIDPNREINPQYLSYVVQTVDGLTFTGMISAETATSVTLTSGRNESRTLLRIDIEEMVSTGSSLMPENFDQQINEQQLADLLAYVTSATALQQSRGEDSPVQRSEN